jgi:plastocyanin
MPMGARIIAALVALAMAAPAEAASLRKLCNRGCSALVEKCKVAGVRRSSCRRDVVRLCRRLGVAYCEAADSTANGCNRVRAEDHRGESLVRVQFSPRRGRRDLFDYAPECILVSPGTTVRFEGRFDLAPLIGGTAPTPDPGSPFVPTSTGETRDFVVTEPGIFPYYCPEFVSFSMWGAVIVGP